MKRETLLAVILALMTLSIPVQTSLLAGAEANPLQPLQWVRPLSSQSITLVGASPGAKRIFAADSSGTIYLLDSQGKLLDTLPVSSLALTLSGTPVESIAPGKPGVLVGESTSWGVLLSLYDGEGRRVYAVPVKGRIASYSIDASGEYLALAYTGLQSQPTQTRLVVELYRDGSIVWRKDLRLASIAYITGVRVSVNGQGETVLYKPDTRILTVYDSKGAVIYRLDLEKTPLITLGLSSDGRRLLYTVATPSSNPLEAKIIVLDLSSNKTLLEADTTLLNGKPVYAVDSRLDVIASWDGDGNVTVYTISQEGAVSRFNVSVPGASRMLLSSDGAYLILSYQDRVLLFSAQSGEEGFEQPLYATARAIAFTPRSAYIIVGDEQGNLYLLANTLEEKTLTLTRLVVGAFILLLGVALIILNMRRTKPQALEEDEEIFPPEEPRG